MARWLAAAVVVGALVVHAFWSRPQPIEFNISFEDALKDAREEGAWLVVHFHKVGCRLAERMNEETFNSPAVESAGHDGFEYALVEVDAGRDLAARLAAPGAALSTVIVDEQGEPVARRDGFLAADEFLAFLDDVRARRLKVDAAKKKLAKDGHDLTARLDLADELSVLGATERAETEVKTTLAELADDATSGPTTSRRLLARAHDRLARLLAGRGQVAAARAELDRSREFADASTADERVASEITEARVLRSEDAGARAAALLEEVVRRYPASPSAAEASALLKEWRQR